MQGHFGEALHTAFLVISRIMFIIIVFFLPVGSGWIIVSVRFVIGNTCIYCLCMDVATARGDGSKPKPDYSLGRLYYFFFVSNW